MSDETMATNPIAQSFQLEVNYAYKEPDGATQSEYFLIDVVDLENLSGFLKQLEKADVDALMYSLNWTRR